MPRPTDLPSTHRGPVRRALALSGAVLLGLLIAASGIWGVLALAISGPSGPVWRFALAAGFGAAALAALVALVLHRWRRPGLATYAALFVAALVWYFNLQPSNERDWVTENALLARATVDGDIVTVRNIRNFRYRSETDFTPAYYDRRFDLRELEGVDVVSVYWMGPHIAHVFLSFAFAGGDHLAVSIEARKEKGEGYSTVNGFFRQYELYYVVADERDVIGLRSNYRNDPPEQVYVYRVLPRDGAARRLFLAYLDQINALAERPAFYNSLTTNCTTTIWMNNRVNPGGLSFSWKVLASGHVPELLHEHGRLVGSDRPFAELQQQAFVNPRARAAGVVDDFSRRIRDTATLPPLDPARDKP